MTLQMCFICNIVSEDCQSNFAEVKSQHSGYPLVIFIRKFVRKSILTRNFNSSDNCICRTCLIRVNEYDSICVKAKQIEDELHRKLIKSDKIWENTTIANQNVTDAETVQNKSAKMDVESSEDLDSQDTEPAARISVSFFLLNSEIISFLQFSFVLLIYRVKSSRMTQMNMEKMILIAKMTLIMKFTTANMRTFHHWNAFIVGNISSKKRISSSIWQFM